MEDMIVLASIAAVVAFDALAVRFGADSRVDDGRRNL
jgi:hypothetical protein